MSDVLTVIIILGLAGAGAAAILVLRGQLDSSRREALQALAARRGWSFHVGEQKLGRPAVLRIAPRGGAGWAVETRRQVPATATGAGLRTTEFDADEPRWADGLAVFTVVTPSGPAVPPELDSPEGQRWLARLLGEDIAKYAAVLQAWPAAEGVILLATTPPGNHFDSAAIGRALSSWRPGQEHPVMVVGPEGFRLRYLSEIRRADRMGAFIDLALDLCRLA